MPAMKRFALYLCFTSFLCTTTYAQPEQPASNDYFHALRLMGNKRLNEALRILKSIQDEAFGYKAIKRIVQIYKSRNDLEGAKSYFELRWGQDSTNTIGLYGLARVAYEQKKYATAIKLLRQAVALGEENISFYTLLSRCYAFANKTKEMLPYFRQLVANDSSKACYWYGLAQALHRNIEYDQALKLYDKLIQMQPDLLEPRIWKQHIFSVTGKPINAIEIGTELLRLAEARHDPEDIAGIMNNLGMFYSGLGNLSKALQYYNKSFEYSIELGLRVDAERTLGNILGLYAALGDPQTLEYFPQAIELAKEINHPDEIARHYNNIGEFYRNVGNNPRALEFFRKALIIWNEMDHKHWGYIGDLFLNIGEILVESGEYAAALDSLNKSLDLARAEQNVGSEADCLVAMGKVYTRSGQFVRALSHYNKSLKIYKESHASLDEGNCWNALGDAYLEMKNYSKATHAHQEAMEIARELDVQKLAWEAHAGLARVNESMGEYSKALHHSKLAIDKIDRFRGELHAEEFKASFQESKLESYERLIDLLTKLHAKDPEAGHDRQAFYYAERAKARTLLDLVYQGQVFQNLSNIEENFRLRFLENAATLERKHADLAKELARPGDAKKPDKIKSIETEIAILQNGRAVLLNEIGEEYPQYHDLTNPNILTVEEVQKKLQQSGQVLIEYFVGKKQTIAWIVRAGQFYIESIPLNREQLGARLSNISAGLFAGATTGSSVDENSGVLRNHAWADIQTDSLLTFYEKIFRKPVEKYLKQGDDLIIIPDDILFYFPFEMLVTAISPLRPHYLVEKYPIAYASSASLLPVLDEDIFSRKSKDISSKATRGLFAIANPEFEKKQSRGLLAYLSDAFANIFRNGSFVPLPFSEEEAKAITEEIPDSEVYVRQHATEEKYKELAGQFNFIHFATHNILDDRRPMLSRLVLTSDSEKEDGFYTVYEIFNLPLNAELVVLSACNTGLGKFRRGEGIIGMTRAFMYAGVPGVVASLWWVEDKTTAYLMKRFYGYLRLGFSKSKALQKAKIDVIHAAGKELKEKTRYAYYWAPFVLFGDSKPVDFSFAEK